MEDLTAAPDLTATPQQPTETQPQPPAPFTTVPLTEVVTTQPTPESSAPVTMIETPPAQQPPRRVPSVSCVSVAPNEFRIAIDGRAIGKTLGPQDSATVRAWVESTFVDTE